MASVRGKGQLNGRISNFTLQFGVDSMFLAAGNAENMGIDAVLAEMRRHAGSANVQERGCGVLIRLAAGNAENQGKIGAQGGIELVLEAMRRHAGSANVQEQGCEALANLACGNAENQGKIDAQGGMEVITDGMQKHKHDFAETARKVRIMCWG